MPALRLLCVGCSNYAPLRGLLREQDPALEWVEAPFGQVYPALLDAGHDAWRQPPDVCLVWTLPHRVSAGFAARLAGKAVPTEQILAEVDELAAAVRQAAGRARLATLVLSWALPPDERGFGCGDWIAADGLAPTVARMNLRLAERLADVPSVSLLDFARCLTASGRRAFDSKLWMLGKIPFGRGVFEEVAAEVLAAVGAAMGRTRKLLVLDLDDTLWGGIVGDDGWEQLQVGGASAVGEAYSAFQHEIQRLARRGVVLAVCSKNDEHVALEALDRHPEMVIRRGDLAAWRINWGDKAENIRALVAELNLGLAATVFIDDSPAERARVREALPEVLVPEWPADPARYASALRALRCFDTWRITEEDRTRAASYAAERQRREVRATAQTLDEWLGRLELEVEGRPLSSADLPRAAQLLNKTNQFNLTTRRMSERELAGLAEQPGVRVFTFRVRDRFGEYGLTGLASLRVDGDAARIEDFVLSCRVMGRGVEQQMLARLRDEALARGFTRLLARYVPTAKNGPCRSFLPDSGFRATGEPEWELELAAAAPVGAGALEAVTR